MAMAVAMAVLDEGYVVAVGMVAVGQGQARRERMRLRDFFVGFQIAVPRREAERLPATVEPFGLQRNVARRPRVSAFGVEPEPRRRAVLEDLKA